MSVVDALLPATLVVGVGAAARAGHRRRQVSNRLGPRSDERPRRHRSQLAAPRPRRSRRDAARFERDLPRFAESMARELRVGGAASAAVALAAEAVGGPIATDAATLRRDLEQGGSLHEALAGWARRRSSVGLDHLVAAIALGVELGGALSPALDATADALRDRLEVSDEIASLTAQSRASAVLLTALPPLTTGGLALVDPAPVRFLVGSSTGVACAAAAGVLLSAGWWWMRRLMSGVQ